MKKVIKAIWDFFCFLISLIFNNIICGFLKRLTCGVCSANFRRRLKKHGKHCYVETSNCFEGLKDVEIGNDFSARRGLWIGTYKKYFGNEYSPSIIIGNNVHFSRNCHIGSINKIVIGNDCLFGSDILINDHNHGNSFDFSKSRNQLPLVSKGEINIGNNVFVGDGSVILGNVTIGDNCVIGANSVVTKSFPSNCVIAGNPAQIIKQKEEN